MLFAATVLAISIHSLGLIDSGGVPPRAPMAAVQQQTTAEPAEQTSAAEHTGAVEPHGTSLQGGTVGRHGAAAVAARHATVPSETRTDLGAQRGAAFLDLLATMPSRPLQAQSTTATVAATVDDHPPSPGTVHSWWAGLGSSARQRLEAAAPSVIGNLDGVPYAVRDRANRTVLGDAERNGDAAVRAMADRVARSLRGTSSGPRKELVVLDLRGAGRAAIAIGDLESAAATTVVVPGMFFTVAGQMDDFTATAGDLYAEQATMSSAMRVGASAGDGVAVVAWMGYRTPDLSNVLSLDPARRGAVRLERFVSGIHSVRVGAEPRITVVAHSYGTTTALLALASGRTSVDGLVLIGSPGSTVTRASKLRVTDRSVYVGDAHWDPIAGTGYYGVDPGSAGFGGTVLNLAASSSAQGSAFRQPFGHNDYLKPGTTSLHDAALVGIGRGDLTRQGHRSGGGDGGDDDPLQSPVFVSLRPQELQSRD